MEVRRTSAMWDRSPKGAPSHELPPAKQPVTDRYMRTRDIPWQRHIGVGSGYVDRGRYDRKQRYAVGKETLQTASPIYCNRVLHLFLERGSDRL